MRDDFLKKSRRERYAVRDDVSCVDEKDTSRDGAPPGGAARLRRTSIFAAGKNLGGGGIHFRRAFQIPPVTIKITTPGRCGYFYGRDG